MNTKKRIDGDYYIETINADDRVIINANALAVNGNLEVSGNLTYINTEQLDVKDPFIVLNSSNTSTYAANAGVLTHKTSSDYAGIRYNTVAGYWEISTSTSATGETGTWSEIGTAVGGSVAGSNTEIQYNDAGSFGASANFTWDQATNILTVTGATSATGNTTTGGGLILSDQASGVPGAVTDSTVLYGNIAGGGGSGVYFVDGSTTDELVSKSKAIVYGIIF